MYHYLEKILTYCPYIYTLLVYLLKTATFFLPRFQKVKTINITILICGVLRENYTYLQACVFIQETRYNFSIEIFSIFGLFWVSSFFK